jgi:asparagine synthase (glutamine-hydrolysing)
VKTKLVEDFLQRLDKMGMRHSVEGRVPFLEPDIARWALTTPQETVVPGFRQKALLRQAVAPVLPEYVLRRAKQGFCPPVAAWCQRLLRDRSIQRPTGPLFKAGLLDARGIDELHRHSARFPFALWTAEMLIDWSNRNLEAPAVTPEVGVAA